MNFMMVRAEADGRLLLARADLPLVRPVRRRKGYARRQEWSGGEIKFRPFSLKTAHCAVFRALEPSSRTNFSAKTGRKSGFRSSFGLTSLHPPVSALGYMGAS